MGKASQKKSGVKVLASAQSGNQAGQDSVESVKINSRVAAKVRKILEARGFKAYRPH